MFEREITDAMFLKRWSIVRTLMPQSVAEHSWAVAMYANDIAVYLGLPQHVHLPLLQYSLWHDAKDEIFTSDLPGPNKRGLLDAIGPEAKEKWDAKLREWSDRVFGNLSVRMGGKLGLDDTLTLLYVVKVADWLEASVRMATEEQMGNRCATRHILPNLNGAKETAEKLFEHLGRSRQSYYNFSLRLTRCVADAQNGQSTGPWITKEDDTRTYHDAALGDAAE